jgi:hypothetical protein
VDVGLIDLIKGTSQTTGLFLFSVALAIGIWDFLMISSQYFSSLTDKLLAYRFFKGSLHS